MSQGETGVRLISCSAAEPLVWLTSHQLMARCRLGFFEGESEHHGFEFGLQIIIKEGRPGKSRRRQAD